MGFSAVSNSLATVSDLAIGTVTVGAAATELKVGAAALTKRKQLVIYPPAAGTIYWGKSGVTSATGAPLASGGSPVIIDLDPNVALGLFAINDGTNRDIKIVEVK